MEIFHAMITTSNFVSEMIKSVYSQAFINISSLIKLYDSIKIYLALNWNTYLSGKEWL